MVVPGSLTVLTSQASHVIKEFSFPVLYISIIAKDGNVYRPVNYYRKAIRPIMWQFFWISNHEVFESVRNDFDEFPRFINAWVKNLVTYIVRNAFNEN